MKQELKEKLNSYTAEFFLQTQKIPQSHHQVVSEEKKELIKMLDTKETKTN